MIDVSVPFAGLQYSSAPILRIYLVLSLASLWAIIANSLESPYAQSVSRSLLLLYLVAKTLATSYFVSHHNGCLAIFGEPLESCVQVKEQVRAQHSGYHLYRLGLCQPLLEVLERALFPILRRPSF